MSDDKLLEDVYVAIEGEPFLSRAIAYKKAVIAVNREWREFLVKVGGAQAFGHREMTHVRFDGPRPLGWAKPNTRGLCRPKVKSEPEALMRALTPKPRSVGVYGDALIDTFEFHDTDNSKNWGSSCIGRQFFGAWVGWIKDDFYGMIPHAANAARNHLAERPDTTVDQAALDWVVPFGLREISKMEFDFILAKYNFEKEQKPK
jgi:hypothetical protein